MQSHKSTAIHSLSFVLLLAFTFASLSIAVARPWNEHAIKLSQTIKQIENGENEIQEMIEQKRHASDPKDVKDLVDQIAARHKALEKTIKEYEDERTHVRFQHPEKNDILERKYTRHEFRSIEDLEREFGIHGQLDRVKARVFATFPLPPKPERSPELKPLVRSPASKPPPDEDAPEKIHLVK